VCGGLVFAQRQRRDDRNHLDRRSGSFNLPVALSNTHAVGACDTGVVSWVNRINPRLARQWLLPVCAETWDGYLNDINGGYVRPEHVEAALDAASTGPVAEGSVGGGTGMNCYEFKGGNGTASRQITSWRSRPRTCPAWSARSQLGPSVTASSAR
jgi:L-aminopeptidase/D-esterase-like protein